jgi:hypothetical protein
MIIFTSLVGETYLGGAALILMNILGAEDKPLPFFLVDNSTANIKNGVTSGSEPTIRTGSSPLTITGRPPLPVLMEASLVVTGSLVVVIWCEKDI